jgi:hypothetical protein
MAYEQNSTAGSRRVWGRIPRKSQIPEQAQILRANTGSEAAVVREIPVRPTANGEVKPIAQASDDATPSFRLHSSSAHPKHVRRISQSRSMGT